MLADRLSENGRYSVILVEAGGRDDHPLIHVPAGVGALIGHAQLDWRYASAPQPDAGGRRIALPRGRVLGGCTSTNGMVYFRGHPTDYDAWAAGGCPGWDWSAVLPYFRRSEDNGAFDGPDHGVGGPVHVSSYRKVNPLTKRFVDAASRMGYREVEDFNSGDPEGFGVRQAMIREGRRVSGSTAYLSRAQRRSNLTILTNRLVDRVLLADGRVGGLLLRAGDTSEHVIARREVILSAGSFGSPAILERSGIGDGNLLRAIGIEVQYHVPGVGRNLQDHVVAPVQMTTSSPLPYVVDAGVGLRLIGNLAAYLFRRSGPLASNVFEATGFVRSSRATDRPDIQLIFMPMHRAAGPVPRKRGYGVLVGLLRPASRGSVHVAGHDPHLPPVIDPQFLAEPTDLPPLVDGVRLARRILSAAPFADLDSQEITPGPSAITDEDIVSAIRKNCVTVHHPVGTCRMGSDPGAVVDPCLRVHGIDGLRVVDAAIMPSIIGGNTAAPVYMIAEKAADLILRATA